MLLTGDQLPSIPSQFLPVKEPETTRDYTYDATADVTFNGIVDTIVSATFAVKPGGEVVPSMLFVIGSVVTVWLSGGVAGRNYVNRLEVSTLGGRTIELLLGQVCDPVLATIPVSPAVTPGFGTSITWTTGATVFGQSFPMVANGLLSAGTNQSTASVMPGQTNIATGGVTGGGFVLPTIIAGTIRFRNVWTSDILIYPPGTAQIGTYGAGAPVIASPNQTLDFTTSAPTVEWVV